MLLPSLSLPAGAVVTAGEIAQIITAINDGSVYVAKAADETINNSATLQNDDELFVTVAANATYEINTYVGYRSNTTADFKVGFTFPTGATLYFTTWNAQLNSSGTLVTSTQLEAAASGSAFGVGGIAVGTTATFAGGGLLTTGANAGTFQVQWAQLTADASNTVVRAGSYLSLRRVA